MRKRIEVGAEHRSRADRRVAPRRSSWLVQDWRRAHKWFSVQAAACIGLAQPAYELLPDAKEFFPEWAFHSLMVLLAIGVILGRLRAQS